MVCKYFDKKSFGCGVTSEIMSKQKLGKLSIRKLKKQKVYLPFKDNIWGAGLADIQLKNVMQDFNFFMRNCIICMCCSLKNKRRVTNTNVLQKILDGSNWKPNKQWVDKGS